MFTINGIITHIGEVRSGISKSSGKTWKSLNFVIENDVSHNAVSMQLFGDKKVDYFLSKFQVGHSADVSFSIETKEYNGKYFNNVNAINVLDTAPRQQATSATATAQPAQGELPF